MAKKFAVFLVALLLANFFNPAFSSQETIRSRAESHFSALGWTDDPSLPAPVERKAIAIPGGDETFPAMTPTGDAGIVAVYPELEGLGKLDYSELDANLLSVLTRMSDCFKNREIVSSVCDPGRSFLAPVNTFRLKKLPSVQSVRFAQPVMEHTAASESPGSAGVSDTAATAATATAAPGAAAETSSTTSATITPPIPSIATCRFRLMCTDGSDGKSVPLFVTVRASRQGTSWFISDITFDGKTYAKLAVQN